ncbi:MAG: VanZ family protein [Terracidiphilus sp.]|jgi:VanZ family protein
MSSSARGPRFWISAWLPVAIGVTVIAFESTTWFGADYTSSPLRAIYQAIFGPVGNARWDVIHHYIRKSGHFIGYGILCLAWLRAWWMSLTLRGLAFWRCALLGLVCTALVASCDEWHQTFLPNRTGTPRDVLLDCCGAAAAILLVYVFARAFRAEKLREAA